MRVILNRILSLSKTESMRSFHTKKTARASKIATFGVGYIERSLNIWARMLIMSMG
nr:MAG TPA: hypothetical protein [Caudoviricetes sp.]